MRKPQTVAALETLAGSGFRPASSCATFSTARSPTSTACRISPTTPDLAIEVGKLLCDQLLSRCRRPSAKPRDPIGLPLSEREPARQRAATRLRLQRAQLCGASGTGVTRRATRAPWPAWLYPGLPTATRRARTGAAWPTGSTTTCPTARCSSSPSSVRSTSGGGKPGPDDP